MVPTNIGKMHIIPAFILATKKLLHFVLRAPALRQVTALTAFMLLKEKNSFFLLIRVKAVKAVTPLCRPALSTKRAPLISATRDPGTLGPETYDQRPTTLRQLRPNDLRPEDLRPEGGKSPRGKRLKRQEPGRREAERQESRM